METIEQAVHDRVRDASTGNANASIDRTIREQLRHYADASEEEIRARITELDKEWDVERSLELNAGALSFVGVILAATVSRKWLILPGVVTAFLVQHAIQGWCPPLPVLRALRIRTRKEIDRERYALVDMLKERG